MKILKNIVELQSILRILKNSIEKNNQPLINLFHPRCLLQDTIDRLCGRISGSRAGFAQKRDESKKRMR